MSNKSYKSINENYPECLFALYISLFAILKPISQPTGHASIILFVSVFLCLVSGLIYNYLHSRSGNYTFFISTFIIISVLLLFDLTIRSNSNTLGYLYNFVIYGAIPLFLISNIKEFKSVLWFYSIFSVFTGIIYIPDPLLSYHISGGYMQLGFGMLLPAFCGSAILCFYFKKRWGALFLFFFLIYSFIFANKSSTICELILLLFFYLYGLHCPKSKMVLRRFLVIVAIILIITFNEQILDFAIGIADYLEVDSYALSTFNMMLNGRGDEVYNLRTDLWEESIAMFNQKPIMGWGVGWFEIYSEQPYPHNVFIQILLEYGFVGILLFFLIMVLGIRKLFRCDNFEKKLFSLSVLILWICPLFVSLTYWMYMYFWIFFGLCFSKTTKRIRTFNK